MIQRKKKEVLRNLSMMQRKKKSSFNVQNINTTKISSNNIFATSNQQNPHLQEIQFALMAIDPISASYLQYLSVTETIDNLRYLINTPLDIEDIDILDKITIKIINAFNVIQKDANYKIEKKMEIKDKECYRSIRCMGKT